MFILELKLVTAWNGYGLDHDLASGRAPASYFGRRRDEAR